MGLVSVTLAQSTRITPGPTTLPKSFVHCSSEENRTGLALDVELHAAHFDVARACRWLGARPVGKLGGTAEAARMAG
jgi:hypothetical protein